MLKSKRTVFAAGLVVCLLAAGGIALRARAASATEGESQLQTASVTSGDIVISATGSAQLIPARSSALSFSTMDTVAEILVDVGDSVKEGGELARLDNEAATVALETAKVALLRLTSDEAIANARISLADAQDELKTATYNQYAQQQGHRASSEVIKLARARVEQAEQSLKFARQRYNNSSGRDEFDNDRVNSLEKVVAAQKELNTYRQQLAWYAGKPSESEQADLEASVALAEAHVAAAQALVGELTGVASPDEAADIASDALIALRQARLDVDAAQAALDATVLTAPFDGVITELNGYVGESSDDFSIGLADVRNPVIDVSVDESDLEIVAVGDPIDLSLDAMPDSVLTGSLRRLDPVLTEVEGIQTVHALAELDQTSLDKVLSLPMGMSGTIEIVHAETHGALLVPVNALHELAEGKYGVFVMESGEPRLREVKVGLQSAVYAEILSGLSLGDTVSLGTEGES
jgi:HlyD family secretion protein